MAEEHLKDLQNNSTYENEEEDEGADIDENDEFIDTEDEKELNQQTEKKKTIKKRKVKDNISIDINEKKKINNENKKNDNINPSDNHESNNLNNNSDNHESNNEEEILNNSDILENVNKNLDFEKNQKNIVEYSYYTDDKFEVFIFPKSLHHNFSILYTNTSIKVSFTAKEEMKKIISTKINSNLLEKINLNNKIENKEIEIKPKFLFFNQNVYEESNFFVLIFKKI
jgi:hypothetical protein